MLTCFLHANRYPLRSKALRRLDAAGLSPHHKGVSRPDGRSGDHRKVAGEESPGSIDIRCRITSGGGNPRDSATEIEPLPPAYLPRLRGRDKGGGSKGEKVR